MLEQLALNAVIVECTKNIIIVHGMRMQYKNHYSEKTTSHYTVSKYFQIKLIHKSRKLD